MNPTSTQYKYLAPNPKSVYPRNPYLTPRGIVVAIKKLIAANVPIADQFIILDHWR